MGNLLIFSRSFPQFFQQFFLSSPAAHFYPYRYRPTVHCPNACSIYDHSAPLLHFIQAIVVVTVGGGGGSKCYPLSFSHFITFLSWTWNIVVFWIWFWRVLKNEKCEYMRCAKTNLLRRITANTSTWHRPTSWRPTTLWRHCAFNTTTWSLFSLIVESSWMRSMRIGTVPSTASYCSLWWMSLLPSVSAA